VKVAKSVLAGILAMSMGSMPVLAQSAAPKAVTADVRANADLDRTNKALFGGGYILPVVIVVAIGLGLYFALDDDDDAPASP
jgi:hypothetical protein